MREKSAEKKIESINNPWYVTLGVNPKEYFEFFKDQILTKNIKELQKDHVEWNLKIIATELHCC